MNKIKSVNILYIFIIVCPIFFGMLLAGFIALGFPVSTYAILVMSQAAMLLPTVCYLILTRTNVKQLIPLRPVRVLDVLLIVLFVLLLIPVTSIVNLLSQLFVSNQVADMAVNIVDRALVLNILFIAVMPALSEEFIFRGVFLHTYRSRSVAKAVLLSAFLFGLMHMNWNQFLYTFLLGLVFALLNEATGSIWSSVIAHGTFNMYSVIMLFLSHLLADKEELTSAATNQDIWMMIVPFLILALIATPLALLVYRKLAKRSGRLEHVCTIFRRRTKDQAVPQPPENIAQPLLTLPLILTGAGCVLYMILSEILMRLI